MSKNIYKILIKIFLKFKQKIKQNTETYFKWMDEWIMLNKNRCNTYVLDLIFYLNYL